MKKSVLITGGAGFIGSHIQDWFLDSGWSVAVLDNLVSGAKDNLHKKTKFYEVDICNENDVLSTFNDFKPSVVIHAAAQNKVSASMKYPKHDLDVNVYGMYNVLAASKHNNVKKFIFTNTGGAFYGDQPHSAMPLHEDTLIIKPESFYNVSKIAGEYYLKLFGALTDMIWVSLRLANVYGPRQDGSGETGIIAVFIDRMLKNERPTIFGDGSHIRDYVYIDDVVEAVKLSLNATNSDYYNISSGVEVSNIEVFKEVKESINFESGYITGPPRPGDVQIVVLDNNKAKMGLGWVPKVGLKEGITKTVSFYS